MTEPLENVYFNWLSAKVLPDNSNIYGDLLRILHNTEFTWIILGDKNRAQDGLELRDDFLRESWFHIGSEWDHVGCSIFEMMVAFAKRASFQTDDPVRDWFWEFITNLELGEFRQVSEQDVIFIDEVLYRFVWRTYDSSGLGGMFPLRWPKRDQRKVEIGYQFFEYLDDQGRT